MRIQHNIMAMSAYRNYTNNVAAMKKNLEKLSSGYKINRAGDDAAGLAISEKMRAQITGLQTAQKNAKDGISLVQTAEGALTEVHDMLNRMVELASQSANGTYDTNTDRTQMQKEINQLRDEINRIADSSNFNGINLLDGSMSTAASKVGSVQIVNSGTAPTITTAVATKVVTWPTTATTAATIGSPPSSTLVHLHSDGQEGSIGKFTIDLGGLDVQSATTGKASVVITIGNQNFTVKASATGGKITASKVAAALKASAVVYATKNGALTIATKGATITKGAIVYSASVSGNRVTFTAAKVMKANGTVGGSATAITSVSDIPRGFKAEHNYSVSMTVSGATDGKDGFVQVGVASYTDTKAASAKQFAQAVVKLNASKISDQMKIKVGNAELTVRMGKDSTGDIDLRAYATTSASGVTTLKSSKAKEIAQAIANAFAHASTGGIEVGVNATDSLVIAEKVTASRMSAATDTKIKDALKTLDGFKSLVSFTEQVKNGETKGTAALTINTAKLSPGNKLTITLQDGTTKEYTVTKDKANANNADYLYVNDDKNDPITVADALKAALARDVGASKVSVDGKNVTIKFDIDGGADLKDIKAKAAMSGNKALRLQIGDTADSYNQLEVSIKDCHTSSLGLDDLSILDQDDAASAIDRIKDAINYVSDVRGTLGATQNRLDHTINNLSVMTENIQDAESTIRDVDVAEEMMAYTKNNILIQSAQAMLAQANQVPQGVLQLLG